MEKRSRECSLLTVVLGTGDPLHELVEGCSGNDPGLLGVHANVELCIGSLVPNVAAICGGEVIALCEGVSVWQCEGVAV